MTESMSTTPLAEHETHIGFEVISGQFVPWCECGWIGPHADTEDSADMACRDHRRPS